MDAEQAILLAANALWILILVFLIDIKFANKQRAGKSHYYVVRFFHCCRRYDILNIGLWPFVFTVSPGAMLRRHGFTMRYMKEFGKKQKPCKAS